MSKRGGSPVNMNQSRILLKLGKVVRLGSRSAISLIVPIELKRVRRGRIRTGVLRLHIYVMSVLLIGAFRLPSYSSVFARFVKISSL